MHTRKVILYIAQSLDGYIANIDDNIDWLPQEMSTKFVEFYEKLLDRIDSVAMGRNTFEQITQKLSPDIWPYPTIKSYVWTTKNLEHPNCISTNEDISNFIQRFHHQQGKDLWIVGGAKFAQQWIEKDLIDEYIITIAPIILGDGISLFSKSYLPINLKLIDVIHEHKLVQLHYTKI